MVILCPAYPTCPFPSGQVRNVYIIALGQGTYIALDKRFISFVFVFVFVSNVFLFYP